MSDTKILSREMINEWYSPGYRKNNPNTAITQIIDSHAAQAQRIEELEAQVQANRDFSANLIPHANAALQRAEVAEAEIKLHRTAAAELMELLREHWKSPDVDAMTIFLGAIVAGIAESWASKPPENGIVHYTEWPGMGPIEIQIRRMPEGKSAAQTILELQDLLRQIREALPAERAREIAAMINVGAIDEDDRKAVRDIVAYAALAEERS